MKHFPDTSFLCSLYRQQITTPEALSYHASLDAPLQVSSLLLLEFRQSIRFQNRLFTKDRGKGFSKNEGQATLRNIQSDLTHGVLAMVAPDWADVHRIAEGISHRHTESGGHRIADILHVATAVHLGSEFFLTFDGNQRRLAEAEGMTAPL